MSSHTPPPMNSTPVPTVWQLAMSSRVLRRALKTAAIVGTILISINHGDALVRGEIDSSRLLKMGLTILTPYLVSTVSSVQTLREVAREKSCAQRGPGKPGG